MSACPDKAAEVRSSSASTDRDALSNPTASATLTVIPMIEKRERTLFPLRTVCWMAR
jgi:hypothetical protein